MPKLINFLDGTTPFVQAFDFLLMLGCALYCLRSIRRRKNFGLAILTLSCFISTVILLGFFLSASPNNHPLLPLTPQAREVFYLSARLLAPFELLLFAVGLIVIARHNAARDR